MRSIVASIAVAVLGLSAGCSNVPRYPDDCPPGSPVEPDIATEVGDADEGRSAIGAKVAGKERDPDLRLKQREDAREAREARQEQATADRIRCPTIRTSSLGR